MSAHRNLRCASTTDGRPVKANAAGGYTVMGGYPVMGFTVVLLLISHDVCMSALPAKPLCWLRSSALTLTIVTKTKLIAYDRNEQQQPRLPSSVKKPIDRTQLDRSQTIRYNRY
jgi:hypothetical protein